MPTRSVKNSQSGPRASAEHVAKELSAQLKLGPKSAAVLVRAGITSQGQLQQLGSIKAYCLAKRIEPTVTLNLLWALEGATLGQSWQAVAKEHRASLLIALEDHECYVSVQ